jgi:hypothetical protein
MSALGLRCLAVSALLGVLSCTRPVTQLVVVVSTDVPASDYACIRSHVRRLPLSDEGDSRGLVTPLPFSFGVAPPSEDPSARVEIAVELRTDACEPPSRGEAEPVVRRVVRTGFLRGVTLGVPIFLAARCVAVRCDGGTTCDPESGLCVAVPDLPPTELEVVLPGEELADAASARDTGAIDVGAIDVGAIDVGAIDAASIDAPGLDAPGVDAPSGPDAMRPDAPLPDAGPGCATVAMVTGMLPTSGTLMGYSLSASPDGAAAIRGLAIVRGSSDWAGAQDVASGSGLGSTYFPPPGTSFGPTGVAYNADASARIAVFGQSGRLTVMPLVGFSTDAFPSGRCPSSRCATRSGATDFAVLTGPSSLTLRRITVSGRTASTAASIAVVGASTNGGVRPSVSGVIVSYAAGGACFVERWPDFVARSGQVRVDDCTQLDAAELASGEIGIAWTDAAFAVRAAVIDVGHTTVGAPALLDATQSMEEPVMVGPTDAGFRVSWVEDTGTPMIRSVELDATVATLREDCAASAADTLTDYRWLSAARRGAVTAVEWVSGGEFHGASFTD